LREAEVIDAWSKIVGEFIAAHSAPVALRNGILYVRGLQPALHYELEQVSKIGTLQKPKNVSTATFVSKPVEQIAPSNRQSLPDRITYLGASAFSPFIH
jgi:hypothetical protein